MKVILEQAVAASGRQSEFGLGLWLVSKIVKAMGESIAFNDAECGGSEFTVALPKG